MKETDKNKVPDDDQPYFYRILFPKTFPPRNPTLSPLSCPAPVPSVTYDSGGRGSKKSSKPETFYHEDRGEIVSHRRTPTVLGYRVDSKKVVFTNFLCLPGPDRGGPMADPLIVTTQ